MAIGQEREAFGVDPFRAGVADQNIVEALEADWLMRHDFRHVIGALIYVRVAEHDQHAFGWAFDEAAGCFENCYAGAFGADEGAGDVEIIFGKKVVEVVARDAARNVGEALAHERGVGGGDLL